MVDDDDDVRASVVSIVQQLGFEVLDAAHGGEALALVLAHHDIALLFTDVSMPVMDGPTLVAEARKLRPTLRVIFASAHVDLPDDAPSIRKPFRTQELEQLISRTLARPP